MIMMSWHLINEANFESNGNELTTKLFCVVILALESYILTYERCGFVSLVFWLEGVTSTILNPPL